MSILRRIGSAVNALTRSSAPTFDLNDERLWVDLSAGGRTLAGPYVTPDSALTFTAAFAAINAIGTDTASLPIYVHQRMRSGSRQTLYDHRLHELLNVSPDGERLALNFRRGLVGRALGWGNGCERIVWGSNGSILRFEELPGSTRAKRIDIDGIKTLVYDPGDSSLEHLPARNVLHLAAFSYDGLNGRSPITLAREAIGLGHATERFGSSYFGNGLRVGGFLKLAGKMSDEAKSNLRKMLDEMHKGSGAAHRIGFLDPGTEYIQTSIAPDEAQFLATRQFQVIEIARMFRVPPNKLMDWTSATYSNIEESNIDYVGTTIRPWCELIEQAIALRCLTPAERAAGIYVEHDMDAFQRGNMQARAEYWTKLRDLGVVSPNIIAAAEDLPAIGPEGDIRLVPLNMTSLANAGMPPIPATPQQAR